MLAVSQYRLKFLLTGIAWFIVAAIGYNDFVFGKFSYSGFTLNFELIKLLIGGSVYFGLLALCRPMSPRPSSVYFCLLIFIYYVPVLVLYVFSESSLLSFLSISLCIALIALVGNISSIRLPIIRNGDFYIVALSSLACFIITAIMIRNGRGLGIFNLNFLLVYEFRGQAAEAVFGGALTYLNIAMTKVFGPLLMAVFLHRKKYGLAIFMASLHVIWFGFTSHKSVIFYPVVITLLFLFGSRLNRLHYIPACLTVLISFVLLWSHVTDDVLMGSLFLRRPLFVPAYLSFAYFDFFDQHSFLFWSNSVLASLAEYPFPLPIAKQVSMFLGENNHANTSFVAMGYAHAGIFGVVFYGLCVGLILRFIDFCSAEMPPWKPIAVTFAPMQSLISNADLTTALLTHGLLLALICLMFLGQSKRAEL